MNKLILLGGGSSSLSGIGSRFLGSGLGLGGGSFDDDLDPDQLSDRLDEIGDIMGHHDCGNPNCPVHGENGILAVMGIGRQEVQLGTTAFRLPRAPKPKLADWETITGGIPTDLTGTDFGHRTEARAGATLAMIQARLAWLSANRALVENYFRRVDDVERALAKELERLENEAKQCEANVAEHQAVLDSGRDAIGGISKERAEKFVPAQKKRAEELRAKAEEVRRYGVHHLQGLELAVSGLVTKFNGYITEGREAISEISGGSIPAFIELPVDLQQPQIGSHFDRGRLLHQIAPPKEDEKKAIEGGADEKKAIAENSGS